MSTVKTNNVQVGQSGTASNNFTLYQPATPDGTVRIANGNAGSTTDVISVTSAGVLGFNSGYGSVAAAYGCRAWVNFDGTTNTIRASGNVSTIADGGVGIYTINFSTAMPDANYTFAGSTRYASSAADSTLYNVRQYLSTGRLAGSFVCQTAQANSSASSVAEYEFVDLIFFR